MLQALEADTFEDLRPDAVAADYAEIALRSGRPADALDVLQLRLGEAPYDEPRFYRLRSRALADLGRTGEAVELTEEGLDRFPGNVPLFAQRFNREPAPDPLLVRRLRRLEEAAPDYRRLLLSYADRLDNPAERRAEIERYFDLGGEDPLASVLMLEVTEDPEAELERFQTLGGLEDKYLIERSYAALPEGDAKTRLRELLRDYTGVMDRDENRDGFIDARYELQGGDLRRWVQDRNSDGVPELDVTFRNRVPRAATILQSVGRLESAAVAQSAGVPRSAGSSQSAGAAAPQSSEGAEAVASSPAGIPPGGQRYVTLRYGDYPDVERAALVGPGEPSPRLSLDPSRLSPTLRRISRDDFLVYYDLRPAALELPILGEQVDWGSSVPDAALDLQFTDALPIVSDEDLRRGAFRRYSLEQGERVTQWLSAGEITREEADRDGDGRVDHRLLFESGVPISGIRDVDDDGRFEVSEQYQNGSLRFIAVDDDDDGVAEYMERHGEDLRLSWDLNEDGEIDVEELRRGRREIQRVFELNRR
jgi:tetratricopeptide (TPR) repeat protein